MIVTTYHAKYHGQSMIFQVKKSYSDRRKSRTKQLSVLPCQGNFLAGFTFVDIHDFDIPLRGGDTLVRHDALYGADVRPGSCL